MSITNVDRIGGFVVGNEANYNASAFGKSIFFAPDTKQLIVDSVKYIPKKLSELTDDKGFLLSSSLGIANGIATLDNSGKVPSTQLPSYVDDVLEYSSSTTFPSIGESGKIYVDTNSNKSYRWSGSMYVEISKSLSLGTTSSTAYRGDLGANNANNIATLQSYFNSGIAKEASKVSHSLTAGNKVYNGGADITINKADLGLGNVENTKLSTWKGTPNITTLGTITSGVWNGSPIVNGYLANSSISIAGESVALGGRINSTTLKEKLGLNNGPYLPLAGGDVTGNLNCYGNAYLGENLQVDGDVSFAGSSFNIDCKTTINSSLSVIGNVQAEELKIGDCTITYDSNNKCLMVDKGIASVSFVSAGGIEESSTIAELQQRVAQLEAQLISLTNKE